jgi:hypothetical protein
MALRASQPAASSARPINITITAPRMAPARIAERLTSAAGTLISTLQSDRGTRL